MRTLIALALGLIMLFPSQSFSQGKPNFVGDWYQDKARGKSPVRSEAFSRGQSDFTRTKRYNLRANINQLNSLMNTEPELVNLIVPYGDKTYTLNLARADVLQEDFTVETDRGRGVYKRQGVQYRGIVDGNPSHIASFNLTPTDKTGFFSTDEGNFVLTKDGNDLIIYNEQTMDLPGIIYCETPTGSVPVTVDPNLISGIGCKTVNVYFECDYAFYQSKGSNINTLTDYVLGFFNQVATLYANEDIAIQVSALYAWTTPDPYVSYTTPSAILNPFRTTRGTAYNGNIAHFLTTRSNINGGIAYVDALCNKAYAYGVSKVFTTYSSFPTYSWTVNVVAHELGHTIASPHTHSCTWSGGALDNCHAPEGSCATGPAPVNGGTIMSYCHTTSTGINFNNGFGVQPGNLLRTRVQNATCIPAGTLATPPVALATNNITANSATLSWTAAPSTNTYTVQYKLASASTWTTATTAGTSYNLTGLSASTQYAWSVKTDCSPFATTINFTTLSGGSSGCTAPTGLASSTITSSGATLSWSAVSGSTGYTVQYKTSAASTWTTVNAAGTSTAISGLAASTAYVWQVKASCSAGYSTQSSFTTAASSSACATPTNLSTSGISSSGATLNWTPVSDAINYTVQYKTSVASTWSSVTAASNSYALTGLAAGTAYVWQVKANCSTGYSSQSSFTTSASSSSGCNPPINLTSSSITASSATLSWSPISGATGYTLQYRRSTTATWTTVSTTSTSRAVSSLAAGASYIWQVKASCSSYSPQASFTTSSSSSSGCGVPTGLGANSITTTAATLTWSPVTNATSYTIRYKLAGASGWIFKSNLTGTSYRLTGLLTKRNYTWAITAKCSNGTTSNVSASAFFTTL